MSPGLVDHHWFIVRPVVVVVVVGSYTVTATLGTPPGGEVNHADLISLPTGVLDAAVWPWK